MATSTSSAPPTSTNGTANGHATKSTPTPNSSGMNYYPSPLTHSTLPPLANENAFLGDVVTTSKTTPDGKPMTAGFFRLEPGTPLDYTYTYHETKVIISGVFTITEVETGRKVKASKGDVFYFGDGVRVIFENEGTGSAVAFFTGARETEKM